VITIRTNKLNPKQAQLDVYSQRARRISVYQVHTLNADFKFVEECAVGCCRRQPSHQKDGRTHAHAHAHAHSQAHSLSAKSFAAIAASPGATTVNTESLRCAVRETDQGFCQVVHSVRMENPEENPDWSISLSSFQRMAGDFSSPFFPFPLSLPFCFLPLFPRFPVFLPMILAYR